MICYINDENETRSTSNFKPFNLTITLQTLQNRHKTYLLKVSISVCSHVVQGCTHVIQNRKNAWWFRALYKFAHNLIVEIVNRRPPYPLLNIFLLQSVT